MDPSKFVASDKRGAQTAREKKEKSKKEEVPLLGDRIKLEKLLLYKASLQKATNPLGTDLSHNLYHIIIYFINLIFFPFINFSRAMYRPYWSNSRHFTNIRK